MKENLPKFQLIYFNLRALAEAPQMMLRYASINYSYEMAWDYYGKPWWCYKCKWQFSEEDFPNMECPSQAKKYFY